MPKRKQAERLRKDFPKREGNQFRETNKLLDKSLRDVGLDSVADLPKNRKIIEGLLLKKANDPNQTMTPKELKTLEKVIRDQGKESQESQLFFRERKNMNENKEIERQMRGGGSPIRELASAIAEEQKSSVFKRLKKEDDSKSPIEKTAGNQEERMLEQLQTEIRGEIEADEVGNGRRSQDLRNFLNERGK